LWNSGDDDDDDDDEMMGSILNSKHTNLFLFCPSAMENHVFVYACFVSSCAAAASDANSYPFFTPSLFLLLLLLSQPFSTFLNLSQPFSTFFSLQSSASVRRLEASLSEAVTVQQEEARGHRSEARRVEDHVIKPLKEEVETKPFSLKAFILCL